MDRVKAKELRLEGKTYYKGEPIDVPPGLRPLFLEKGYIEPERVQAAPEASKTGSTPSGSRRKQTRRAERPADDTPESEPTEE